MTGDIIPQNEMDLGPALTPSELINAALKTNIFGGYSKNQVDMLLERAAETLESLIQDNQKLAQRQKTLEQELDKYRDMENSLCSALISSQKMGENMVASAKIQADALLEEARVARAQAVFKMEKLPQALRSEIQRLVDARDRLRDALDAVLQSQGELISRIPRAEDQAEEFVRAALAGICEPGASPEPEDDFQQQSTITLKSTQIGLDKNEDVNGDQGYVNL